VWSFGRSPLGGGLPPAPSPPPRLGGSPPARTGFTQQRPQQHARWPVRLCRQATPSPARQRPAHGLRARLTVLPLYGRPHHFGRRFPMTTRSWIRRLFARTPRTIRKAPARFRPRLELLEDRLTPAASHQLV